VDALQDILPRSGGARQVLLCHATDASYHPGRSRPVTAGFGSAPVKPTCYVTAN
jgi:hypothetical protein